MPTGLLGGAGAGGILGGAGGIAGLNPYVLAAQAVFSIYNGYRQREKLEKQRAEATAIHVARPGQTAVVPLCYGRFKSKATPVDVATSGRYTAPGAAPDIVFKAQRWNIPGSPGGNDRRSGDEQATAGLDRSFSLTGDGGVPFLTTRWSGPVGPIHKVWWIRLNGIDHDFARWCSGQRIHVRLNGGADALASGNGIPAASKLTGRVAVTGVFRNTLLKPYGEQRIPFDLDLYGEGKLVRTIVDDGSGNLSLSAVRVYSNNPILVAIDYMTDPVNGWGMPDSLIDLATAKAAADICDTFVDTLPGNMDFVLNRRGSVWRRPGEWDDETPPYRKFLTGEAPDNILEPDLAAPLILARLGLRGRCARRQLHRQPSARPRLPGRRPPELGMVSERRWLIRIQVDPGRADCTRSTRQRTSPVPRTSWTARGQATWTMRRQACSLRR